MVSVTVTYFFLVSQLWLNEGFATWAGWLAVDAQFPEWCVWDQYLSNAGNSALCTDAMLSSHAIEIPIADPKLIDQVSRTSKVVGSSCELHEVTVAW